MNIIEWFEFHGIVNQPGVRDYLGQMTAGEFLDRLMLDRDLELEWEGYIKGVYQDAVKLPKHNVLSELDRAKLRKFVRSLTKSETALLNLYNIGLHLMAYNGSLGQVEVTLKKHYTDKGLIYTIQERGQ